MWFYTWGVVRIGSYLVHQTTSGTSPRWFFSSNTSIYVNLISIAVYVSHAQVDVILERMDLFQHLLHPRDATRERNHVVTIIPVFAPGGSIE